MDRPVVKAAIDIGSNSIRLLIAESFNNEYFELYRDIITTRLGEGVQTDNILTQKSMETTVQALQNFWEQIKNYNAQLVSVVATSAVREAGNSQEFLQKVDLETQLTTKIEIIDGNREAELTYKGVAADFGTQVQIFDLGGGSLELISPPPEQMQSVTFGAVKAAELFCDKEGKVGNPELINDKFQEKLFDVIGDKTKTSDLNKNVGYVKLVGVGGTATYLAKAYKRIPVYDSNVVHGTYLDSDKLSTLLNEMNKCNLDKRVNNFYIPRNRADIIVAGGYIIRYLLDYLDYTGYYASDSDILKGMILEQT